MDLNIKRGAVLVAGDCSMEDVVLKMIESNVSSVLVYDIQTEIVGIITERDIVRRFTLLAKSDKLDAKAFAFMNRPVRFVRINHIEEDIEQLLMQEGLRHFPITACENPKSEDIIGVMTVTDLARNYLRTPSAGNAHREILLLSKNGPDLQNYRKLFETMGYTVIYEEQRQALGARYVGRHVPIVCDIDGMPVEEAKSYLQDIKDHVGGFLLLSSDERVVSLLQGHLQGKHQVVASKPLNVSSILKFLSQNAAVSF